MGTLDKEMIHVLEGTEQTAQAFIRMVQFQTMNLSVENKSQKLQVRGGCCVMNWIACVGRVFFTVRNVKDTCHSSALTSQLDVLNVNCKCSTRVALLWRQLL